MHNYALSTVDFIVIILIALICIIFLVVDFVKYNKAEKQKAKYKPSILWLNHPNKRS